MQPDPQLVTELRTQFKLGATPSALVRTIAERYPDESQIDRLVRAYFREAFHIPMLRIGREQVEHIRSGGEAAWLNRRVPHQIIAFRGQWDSASSQDESHVPSWADSLTAKDEFLYFREAQAQAATELGDSWASLDEQQKQFICRTVASAQSLYEQVQVLAALAEQLQQQLHAAEIAQARAG